MYIYIYIYTHTCMLYAGQDERPAHGLQLPGLPVGEGPGSIKKKPTSRTTKSHTNK